MGTRTIQKVDQEPLPDISQLCAITANLPTTPERRKLLAVLSLPQSITMTAKDICTYANIHRNTYYNAKQDPAFNALQVQVGRIRIQAQALKHLHKYDEVAMQGNTGALERLMEQQGTLDPVQRNVNVQGAVVGASLSELVALIKEEQIDSDDIRDVVEVIESEQDGEGSTVESDEVPPIPQENIGPSLSEKNNNSEDTKHD